MEPNYPLIMIHYNPESKEITLKELSQRASLPATGYFLKSVSVLRSTPLFNYTVIVYHILNYRTRSSKVFYYILCYENLLLWKWSEFTIAERLFIDEVIINHDFIAIRSINGVDQKIHYHMINYQESLNSTQSNPLITLLGVVDYCNTALPTGLRRDDVFCPIVGVPGSSAV
jgi:hypothetical protein